MLKLVEGNDERKLNFDEFFAVRCYSPCGKYGLFASMMALITSASNIEKSPCSKCRLFASTMALVTSLNASNECSKCRLFASTMALITSLNASNEDEFIALRGGWPFHAKCGTTFL